MLDQAPCDESDSSQTFTLGASSVSADPAITSSVAPSASGVADVSSSAVLISSAATSSLPSPASPSSVAVNTAASVVPTSDPTTPPPVSRAGGVLDPSAAAEANEMDNTAVKAFSSVALKDASGQCLFVDPTAGDFRQNLIPITLHACDGSQNQAWDIVTSGKHNNVPGSVLVVSSLVSSSFRCRQSSHDANKPGQTQGCLNFDPRRASGDTVIMFSCGGRADGGTYF